MITDGQIVLVRFSQSGQTEAKLRPALVGRRIPRNSRGLRAIPTSTQRLVLRTQEIKIP